MPGPFVERFRAIVEPLFGRRFTAADGISEEELDAIQGRIGYELPEALGDFYTVVGRYGPVLEAHHRFYSPGRFLRKDGKRVFCEENQVVLYWGYDDHQGWRADPPVYQELNNDEVEWRLEAERCSDFLAGMIYWQALHGGLPHARFDMTSEAVRAAVASWPMVYEDESSQLFSRGSAVSCLTRREEGVEVQAAALTEVELDKVWRALGLEA